MLKLLPTTKAVLWDMDGVIIDSLQFDYKVCSPLLSKYLGKEVSISEELIKRYFAFAHREFWEAILTELGESLSPDKFDALEIEYHDGRKGFTYDLYPGVVETLKSLKEQGITSAVVSSNETELIEEVLKTQGIRDYFQLVVGWDAKSPLKDEPMRKKPAPDMYEAALALLGLNADEVIVIEDSIAGATAGLGAKCRVAAISTGGASFEALSELMAGKNGYVIRSLI